MQYLPTAPDTKVLSLWPDPVAQAAFRVVDSAFGAVAQRGADLLAHDHRLAHPISLALASDRLRQDFAKLHKLLLIAVRYFKRALWPVVAGQLRRQLADTVQRIQVDIALLHSAIPFADAEESEIVGLCADAFQIHRSEYVSLRNEAKKLLQDLMDVVREKMSQQRLGKLTGVGSSSTNQQQPTVADTTRSVMITDDLPEYAALLRRFHNEYLHQVSRACVPSESVGLRQQRLMGQQFASPLVGAVSCFQSMLRAVDEYRKQITQLSATQRAGAALEDLTRAVALLFQQADDAISSGSEAILWSNAFSNTAKEILTWIGPSHDSGSEPAQRTALPTASVASRCHVAGQLMSFATLAVELNKAFGELREYLGLLEETCEFLLSAVGQVRHSQSAALFPMAHGVATLLRDVRTLGAVLSEEAVRFYTATVPQSADTAADPPTCDEVLCHIFPHLAREDAGASISNSLRFTGPPLVQCRQTVANLAAIVATVRLSITPVAPSLQVLRQSLSDHRQTVAHESAKNAADMAALEEIVMGMQLEAQRNSEQPAAEPTLGDEPRVADRLDRAHEELRRLQSLLAPGDESTTNDARLPDDVAFVSGVVGAVLGEASTLHSELLSVLAARQPLDDPATERFLEAMDCFATVMENLCPIVLRRENSADIS